MARERLTPDQQTYVVQALACFDSPSTVAAAVKKDFGLVVSPQSMEAYDPTKRSGAKLAKKWRALFHETRKAFLEDTSAIGISHRAVRLRALQRMADKAESQATWSWRPRCSSRRRRRPAAATPTAAR
ncbi:DUF2280 domain-containing protein [Salipiger pacificus]|nr:DUF2280 domain-containing protein [Alloyangia pacifica]